MLSTWTDACCPEGAVRGLASKVPLARGPRQPPGGWGRLYLVRGKRRRRGWSVPGLSWPAAGGRRLEGPWVRPRLGGGHWPLQARRGEDSSIHCPNLLNRSEHLLIIQWVSHHCHWPSKVNTRWHIGQNNGDSCMQCPIRH